MTVHHLLWAISLLLQLGTSVQKVNIYLYLTPTCACANIVAALSLLMKMRIKMIGNIEPIREKWKMLSGEGIKMMHAALFPPWSCHFFPTWFNIFLIMALCKERALRVHLSMLGLAHWEMISPVLSVPLKSNICILTAVAHMQSLHTSVCCYHQVRSKIRVK